MTTHTFVPPLSGEEYRTLVEKSPLLIWRCDPQGSCDYFNERWLSYRGRSLAQEVGMGWVEGVHPEDARRCVDTFLVALHRRIPFEMEYRLQRHDRAHRWIFDRGTPFFAPDGALLGYIGSCVDIHDRVEAQRLLDQARERELEGLRGLLDVCSHCKRIRNSWGVWESLESFVDRHSKVDFSHGMCGECFRDFQSQHNLCLSSAIPVSPSGSLMSAGRTPVSSGTKDVSS